MVFINEVLMFYRFYELCRSVYLASWVFFYYFRLLSKTQYKIKYEDNKKII